MSKELKDRIISVRLTETLAAKLKERATALGQTSSDALRLAALSLFVKPVGYRCEHMNITGPEGVFTSVTFGCGCDLLPVFDATEVAAA